jgi:type IV pilus assembly protein PilB
MVTSTTHLPAGVTPPTSRGRSTRRIGDVIVDLGFSSRERVEAAVEDARRRGVTTGRVLLEHVVLTHDQLARAVAERFGLDYLDLTVFDVDMGAANLIDPGAAKRLNAVPVAFIGDQKTLLVAMADPADVIAIDDLAMLLGREVRPAVASPEDIGVLIGKLTQLDYTVQEVSEEFEEEKIETVELHDSADQAPVIKLVRSIIAQAVDRGASDIHFEPNGRDLRVRFRIDGLAVDSATVPAAMAPGVISRIKILAHLDIAEKRVPQDGRVGLVLDGREIDVRVVTLPLVGGESAVLRILDPSNTRLDIDSIGMADSERERFLKALGQTYGAILATGPTGSGKTSTLYAGLAAINTPEKTILTIEDPVEYHIEGIKQVQVNTRTGLTFAKGLRAMLRADPDVLLVGEIRDQETARVAIESALTGHLMLSTLHTNDAASAIPRLIDMGTEPFLVASAVDCVVAQRLVRTLCDNCRAPERIPAERLREHRFVVESDIDAYRPVGCSRCAGSGYRGRTGLYEVLVMTEDIRELAIRRESAEVIGARARAHGMRVLREDGLLKVKAGLTSIAEVTRVIGG